MASRDIYLMSGDVATLRLVGEWLILTVTQQNGTIRAVTMPANFLPALENLVRGVVQGEPEMVYVIPQETKEQAG